MLFVTGCLQGTLLVMCIIFEVRARKATKAGEERTALNENGNSNRHNANARCVVGYLSSQNRVETDDEGGAVVENERSPLIKKQTNTPRQET